MKSRHDEIITMLRKTAGQHVRPPGRIFIFGSQANRKTLKRADIDIGVDLGRKMPPADYFNLLEDLADLPMLYPIDLVDFAVADADFRRIAESEMESLL